jgi:hypothetical protein
MAIRIGPVRRYHRAGERRTAAVRIDDVARDSATF